MFEENDELIYHFERLSGKKTKSESKLGDEI